MSLEATRYLWSARLSTNNARRGPGWRVRCRAKASSAASGVNLSSSPDPGSTAGRHG